MNKLIIVLWVALVAWFVGSIYLASGSKDDFNEKSETSIYSVELMIKKNKLIFESPKFGVGDTRPVYSKSTKKGLDSLCDILLVDTSISLILAGYNIQNEDKSIALIRAQNVANYFTEKGLSSSRIILKHYSIDHNDDMIKSGNVFFSIK